MNDGRKSRFDEDDIGGRSGGIGSTFDGDSDVGSRKGGSVVSSISSLIAIQRVSNGRDTTQSNERGREE